MMGTRLPLGPQAEGGELLGAAGSGHGPAAIIREMARDLLRQQRLQASEAARIDVALRDHDWSTVRSYIDLALGRGAVAAPAPAVAAPTAAQDGDESAAGLLRILLQMFDALPRLLVHDPDLSDRLGPIRALLTARPTRERLEEVEARLTALLEQQIALHVNMRDARSSIKDMLGVLVQRLGSIGTSTDRFQEQVGYYQRELEANPEPAVLERVVDGLLRDTRAVSLAIRQSQQDLADARRKVEAYETRVRALEQELAQTSRMVQNDPLTHALNRRGLDEIFRVEVSRAVRYQVPLTVVMIDLDDFKIINDTLGHAAGDRALIHFVTTAQACLRSTELIARTGGEEFVLAFPATPVESAFEAVRRLQRELARNPFVHDGTVRVMTFSGGATSWLDGETLAQTLQRADAAMYAAKRAGKNRVVIAG